MGSVADVGEEKTSILPAQLKRDSSWMGNLLATAASYSPTEATIAECGKRAGEMGLELKLVQWV